MARPHQTSRSNRRPFCRSLFARALRCEQLEDRRLLAQLTVNTDQDVVDFNDGLTSLREAIFAANIVPGADEIVFDFGHDGPATILLTQGELRIEDSLTITGPGAELLTIDASGITSVESSSVFNISDGKFNSVIDVSVEGLTLTGAQNSAIRSRENLTLTSVKLSDNKGVAGGAVWMEPLLSSGGFRLTIIDSTIVNNSADSVGGALNFGGSRSQILIRDSVFSGNKVDSIDFGRGGAIFIQSQGNQVDIIDTRIEDNSARHGGGVWVNGFFETDVRIIGSEIARNTAWYRGGGIYADVRSLHIERSAITENVAGNGTVSASGGGLWSWGVGDSEVVINESTICGNSATGSGGGVNVRGGRLLVKQSTFSENVANDGGAISAYSVVLSNSTVSGNTAQSTGGGIYSNGSATILSSTITANSAGQLGGGISARQNVFDNSLIAGNTADLMPDVRYIRPGVNSGSTFNLRYSLIGTNEGTTLVEAPVGSPDANGNLIGGPINGVIDPLLGPLADNGGPTLTHALLAGSPAINAGEPVVGPGFPVPPLYDQRGEPFVRVSRGRIDIGAFEAQLPEGNTFVVDTLVDENDGDFSAGDFSLREAIALANQLPGTQTIEFAIALSGGAILLEHGELVISDALTVNGLGAELLTIDASGNDPTPEENNGDGSGVFIITSGGADAHFNVTLERLTLTGGDTWTSGGAIHSWESLLLRECVVVGNSSIRGGGMSSIAPLEVVDSVVTGNTARPGSGGRDPFGGYGGGIWAGELRLIRSSVTENTARLGAGVFSSDTLIESSLIADNVGTGIEQSGDLLVRDSAVVRNTRSGIATQLSNGTIVNSTISGNAMDGVRSLGGQINVEHATITNNQWGITALGLYGQVRVFSSIIAGNSGGDVNSPGNQNNFLSAGYNLVGTGGAIAAFDGPGDKLGVDPLLGPLADNGGPTLTHALLAGSPAINAGDPALVAGVGDTPEFDQRGEPFTRVFGTRIDLGAFERQSIVVDTLIDEMDGNYGAGDLSLREAIALAESHPGHDTIEFSPILWADGPATIELTIVGEQMPEWGPTALAIKSSLSIIGPGAEFLTIDASPLDVTPSVLDWAGARVFGITDDNSNTKQSVHIEGLSITGGDTYWGGSAIMSFEDLTLSEVYIVGNLARRWGAGVWIFEGNANIERSVISGNSSLGRGGGVAAGFFLHNRPTTVTISDSTISDNEGFYHGGGIYAHDTDLTIRNCTITNNRMVDGVVFTQGLGGGIHIEGRTENITRIVNSLIHGNHGQGGGGISVEGATVRVVNSTVSGNSAANNSGGIFVNRGLVEVDNSTIVFNESQLTDAFGVGIRTIYGSATVENSIVWCNTSAGGTATDITGFDQVDYSLIGMLPQFLVLNGVGNIVGVDPLLGPLADNGGPTLTHALLAGSPAINAGEPVVGPGFPVPPLYDQRGEPFVRVSRGRVDIGAFEAQLPEGNTFVVDTLEDENDGDFSAGDFSLREAIALANQLPGTQTIEFAIALSGGAILLEHGELVITDALTVNGLGAELLTIDASGNDPTPEENNGDGSRVILVTNAGASDHFNVTLEGLTLTGGDNSTTGGAVHSWESLLIRDCIVVGNASIRGGGVFSSGPLEVVDSMVTGNTARTGTGGRDPFGGYGGGILAGELRLIHSRVTENTARLGAGLQSGHTFIESSLIADNHGTGIEQFGDLLIRDSAIVSNAGRGITTQLSNGTITNSTISGNAMGGLHAMGGQINVEHSTITNNQMSSSGGGGITALGLYGEVRVLSSIIAGNSGGDVNSPGNQNNFLSAGYNLVGTGDAVTAFKGPGDLVGVDPLLAPLADNGGPTRTHALLAGSPAINAGDPTAVAGANGVSEQDQRGGPFARIVDGRIDIGAFEFQPVAGTYNADFDGDGDVDGRDFLRWQRGYGTVAATKADGDATGNGTVDANDLAVWRDTYGNELPAVSDQLLASEGVGLVLDNGPVGRNELYEFRRSDTPSAGTRVARSCLRPIRDDTTEALSVDRAFEDWRPVRATTLDFGDIVTCRAAKARCVATLWED